MASINNMWYYVDNSLAIWSYDPQIGSGWQVQVNERCSFLNCFSLNLYRRALICCVLIDVDLQYSPITCAYSTTFLKYAMHYDPFNNKVHISGCLFCANDGKISLPT